VGKNKKKNNAQQSSQSQKPVIKVVAANEIETTEEGEILLAESLEKMEAYCEERKEEAEKYYEAKRVEADNLRLRAEADIESFREKERKNIEKSMKTEIEKAHKDAQEIISKAEEKKKESEDLINEQQAKFDLKMEEYEKAFVSLETKKGEYKQEILKKFEEEFSAISQERDNLQSQLDVIQKTLDSKNKIIKDLEEEKLYYEDELKQNLVRKADILSYTNKIAELENNYHVINTCYENEKSKVKKQNELILKYGDNPLKAIEDNVRLKKRVDELENILTNYPSLDEIDKLREVGNAYQEIEEKFIKLKEDNQKLTQENKSLNLNKDDIEMYRMFIKTLELQKSELKRELDRIMKSYESTAKKVFANLSEIDEEEVDDYPTTYVLNLKDLCDNFRGYLMNRTEDKKLFYDIKTIRTFIAGFSSSRLMILEGLSGTGKSSLPQAFADFVGAKVKFVPVQSSWKDRNDLLGFYNDFKKQYKETEFLKALYKSSQDNKNIYCIVLDEMNLSRIEYYFADLLSVLESKVENWKIELISDYASISQKSDIWPNRIHNGCLQICDNVWFIGTANKDDSTFTISDKVYDRSVVLNFDKKGEFDSRTTYSKPLKVNNMDFQNLLDSAVKFKNPSDETRYEEMIRFLDDQIRRLFSITFGNRIEEQLKKFVPAYIACGGTVDEAVDMMFSRKILRKLDGLYDEKSKDNLIELMSKIDGKYNMPVTEEVINRMVDRI